jgi:glucose/arabinose dehydrogenase
MEPEDWDRRIAFWLGVLCFILWASSSRAFQVQLVTGGFSSPVAVTAPPGDTNRLFVIELSTGRIRIYDRSTQTILTSPFMTVPGIVTGGERGLLGIAFHPNYANNGYFYVNYVATGGGAAGHTEITRFTATGDPLTSNVADPATKKVILTYDQPEDNHNGGWVGFGTDGYLYIAAGDGGGGNDQHGTIGNAQDRTVLLGKIMRIDVDGGDPYAIPDGNPYKGDLTFRNEIWAFGVRNPFRCSIDRQTGDLWIGDVGESTREEVDYIPAGTGGLNLGWRVREGTLQNSAYPSEQPVTTPTDPVFDYARTLGTTVIGGYLYRGNLIPELQGKYIFGDFGSGRYWTMTHSGSTFTAADQTSTFNTQAPVSFGEDGAGELFILNLGGGNLYRIIPDAPTANGDVLFRQRNQSAKIHYSDLVANDSNPSGQPLQLTANTPSANGANILQDGNWVIYEPPAGFNSSDSFTYTITDGAGSSANATVAVLMASDSGEQTKNIISVVPNGSDVTVVFVGIADRSYEIQTTSSLSPPITWTAHPAGAQTAGPNGAFTLTDPAPPSPRFYRAIQTNP